MQQRPGIRSSLISGRTLPVATRLAATPREARDVEAKLVSWLSTQETTWAAYVRKKKDMIPQGRACRDCMQLLLDVWPGVSWGDHATKYTANIDDHKTKVDMAKEIKLKKIEAPFNQAEVRSTETVGSYLYWDGIVLDSDQFTKKFLHTHEGIPDVMEISLNRNLDGAEEKTFAFQGPDQPYRKIRFFSQCDLSKSIGLLPAEKHLVDGQARA
eukprot:3407011-Pyramimonas_sp.AAC.1